MLGDVSQILESHRFPDAHSVSHAQYEIGPQLFYTFRRRRSEAEFILARAGNSHEAKPQWLTWLRLHPLRCSGETSVR